ncbi:MAG: hypothetical protein U5K69_22920 [Balneolaceae bacterium]|nr:hypothetical protein [Balneolaceae bacterium]
MRPNYTQWSFIITKTLLLILLTPLFANSQSIEFQISDCLAYKNEEIMLDKTRKLREDCEEESLYVTFYPETDIVELEIDVIGSGLNNQIYKMKPSSGSTYQKVLKDKDTQPIMELNLNNLFSYIRGGKVEISGEGLDGNFHQIIIKFERA